MPFFGPNGQVDITPIESQGTWGYNTPSEYLSNQPQFSPEQGELLTFLNQQNDDPGSAAEMLKIMAKDDPAYAELYAQLKAERENQERAYQWYEDFNSKYYQRTTKDLESAGLNPWLALQSLGSGGSGSVSSAGTFGNSNNTLSAQKKTTQMRNESEINQKVIGGIGTVLAAIAGALIMALI